MTIKKKKRIIKKREENKENIDTFENNISQKKFKSNFKI